MFIPVLLLGLVCAVSAQQKSFFDGVEELLRIHCGSTPRPVQRLRREATSAAGLTRSFLEDFAADITNRQRAVGGAFMSELSGLVDFVRSLDVAAKEAERRSKRAKRRGGRRTRAARRKPAFRPLYGSVNYQVLMVTFRVPFHDFKLHPLLDPYPVV